MRQQRRKGGGDMNRGYVSVRVAEGAGVGRRNGREGKVHSQARGRRGHAGAKGGEGRRGGGKALDQGRDTGHLKGRGSAGSPASGLSRT